MTINYFYLSYYQHIKY